MAADQKKSFALIETSADDFHHKTFLLLETKRAAAHSSKELN